MGGEEYGAEDVRSRVHTGTANFAAFLTVPDALDFHQAIGAPAKATRLAHLRDLWAEPARALPGVEVLTSTDPRLAAGIGALRLRGRTTSAENTALARTLLERFNIFTVQRTGLAGGACIRVTPGVFTSEADVLKLVEALKLLGAG